MKTAISILNCKTNEEIKEIDALPIDYLHLDIMDGKFVPNKTWSIEEIKPLLKDITKPLDVHLMVEDINTYIDDFKTLKPEFITYHFELTVDHMEIIRKIKDLGIKVGISIKPNTPVEELTPLLSHVDLILIMSVEPGAGGQKYLTSANEKIAALDLYKQAYNYQFIIEVDGGVNEETIKECNDADLFVIGSAITKSDDYLTALNKIKSNY